MPQQSFSFFALLCLLSVRQLLTQPCFEDANFKPPPTHGERHALLRRPCLFGIEFVAKVRRAGDFFTPPSITGCGQSAPAHAVRLLRVKSGLLCRHFHPRFDRRRHTIRRVSGKRFLRDRGRKLASNLGISRCDPPTQFCAKNFCSQLTIKG